MIGARAATIAAGTLLAACVPPGNDTGATPGETRSYAYRGTWDGQDFQRATLQIADRRDGGQTVTGTSVLDYSAVLAMRLAVTETVQLDADGRVESWVQDQRNVLGAAELEYHFEIDAGAASAVQGLADRSATYGWSGDEPVLTYATPSDEFFEAGHPTPVAGYVTARALASGQSLRLVLPYYGGSEVWQARDDPAADCWHWFDDLWCTDADGVPESFVAASYGLPVERLDDADDVDLPSVVVPEPTEVVPAPDCAIPERGPRHLEYEVASADGTPIAGRLLLPEGPGPFPTVTTNSGTGGSDRAGTVFPSAQWDCLAHGLLGRGIAVASYDDRGHGASGGTPSDSFQGRTDDVVAVARWVQARPEVGRLYLLGHSEGVAHVTAAAATQVDADGLVLVAGLSGTGAEGWIEQARVYLEGLGFPEAQVTALVDGRESLVDGIGAGSYGDEDLGGLPVAAFWEPYLAFDGTAMALATDAPVLIVQGGRDWQVPPHHGADLDAALRLAQRDVTLATFPPLGHLLQPAIGPAPCGLEYHLPWSWDPAVTAAIGAWIEAREPAATR